MPLTRIRRWLRVQPASRYPADPRAIFILVFAILVGAPLLFARIAPGSIAEIMPLWGVIAWGYGLVLGSFTTLVGMTKQSINGVIIEQVGSVVVGVVTVVYGACVVLVGGGPAAVAGAIIFAFGISCFYRWFQLEALLVNGQKLVDRVRQGESLLNVTDEEAQDAIDIAQARERREGL